MSSPSTGIKIPRERLPYSAIVDRPKRKLPGGARVVVWPIVNVEDWDINRPMARIDHDKKGYSPERVVAAATADTKVDGDSLLGRGAAVRSKGKWYSLSFVCKTSADHMQVLSFDYQIGAPIPKEKWEEYNLFD